MNIYALISNDGTLQLCDGTPWHTNDTVASRPSSPATVTIHRPAWGSPGLLGLTSSEPRRPDSRPANRVASALIPALGGPPQDIHGSLAICGTQTDTRSNHPKPGSLSRAQQRLIRAVHAAVLREMNMPCD
ncbi:hypothetical protein [Streptomyces parvulus]|uniref:hypothetical protein n=1 Tax=Streptomyces parvulus TaxID=146923 RepID=UPI00367853DF